MIGAALGEILRHLALPERIVERLVDVLRLDAEACGLVAVDDQREGAAVGLLIGRDVAQLGQGLQLVGDPRRPGLQLVEIGVLQRVLILRPRQPAADVEILRRLHEERDALDLGQLRPQAGDDLVGGGRPLARAASGS